MKRLSIIFSLIILNAVFCTFQICTPKQTYPDTKVENHWRENNEKEMFALDHKYNHNLSVLQERADSLQKELSKTKSSLTLSKQKLRSSELKLFSLAQKDTSSNVIEQLSDCDSLKAEVIAYVNQVDSTRNLYDSTISQLQSLVAVKDTSLFVCKASYDKLKILSEDNLRREQRLTEELEQSIKVQKRKTLQNKFLSAGFLILSGIVTSILIKAK